MLGFKFGFNKKGLTLPTSGMVLKALVSNNLEDSLGASSGPIQPGRSYTVGTITIDGLLDTDVVSASYGFPHENPITNSGGVLTIPSGEMPWSIIIEREGDIIGDYPCAEGSGTIAFNISTSENKLPNGVLSGSGMHGIINNGDGYDLNINGFSIGTAQDFADEAATISLDGVHIPAGASYYDNSTLTDNVRLVGPLKLDILIMSGTGPSDWMIKLSDAPSLRSVLGLDNIYFDMGGISKEVIYADFGNDIQTFDGTKGIVVYRVDMSGKAAKINDYLN